MKGRACQTLAALPRPPSAPARRGSPGRRRTSVWARALPDMQRGGRTMAAAAVGDRRRRRRSSSSAHARRGEWYRPLTRPPAPPPPRPAEPPPPPPHTHTARPAGTGSPHRTPSEGRRLPAAAGQPHGRRDPSAPAGVGACRGTEPARRPLAGRDGTGTGRPRRRPRPSPSVVAGSPHAAPRPCSPKNSGNDGPARVRLPLPEETDRSALPPFPPLNRLQVNYRLRDKHHHLKKPNNKHPGV